MTSYYLYVNNMRAKFLEQSVVSSKRHQSRLIKLNKVILKNGSIILFGDSILESLDFKNTNIHNFSIGGETIGLLNNRIQKYKFPDFCKIVIMIGVNDFLFNVNEDKTKKDFKNLIEFVSSKIFFSNIYILEILPISAEGFFVNRDKINKSIQIFNNNIRMIVKNQNNNNVKVISLYDQFKNHNSNLKSELTNDGVHLNENGKELLKKNMLNLLDDNKNK